MVYGENLGMSPPALEQELRTTHCSKGRQEHKYSIHGKAKGSRKKRGENVSKRREGRKE